MTQHSHYTFGDSELSAQRLAALAEAYGPSTRAFLRRFRGERPRLALDLGCGPGHTTRLLHEEVGAERTIGVDSSEAHLERARRDPEPGLSFVQHDLTQRSEALGGADLVFVRFLLTHLAEPVRVLRSWAELLTDSGRLLVQETSRLESDEPALARYYELVGALQHHYGQALHIGRDLASLAERAGLFVQHFEEEQLVQPARVMARLHALNLRTWSQDAAARQLFDARELERLGQELGAIAAGEQPAAPVRADTGLLVATQTFPGSSASAKSRASD